MEPGVLPNTTQRFFEIHCWLPIPDLHDFLPFIAGKITAWNPGEQEEKKMVMSIFTFYKCPIKTAQKPKGIAASPGTISHRK